MYLGTNSSLGKCELGFCVFSWMKSSWQISCCIVTLCKTSMFALTSGSSLTGNSVHSFQFLGASILLLLSSTMQNVPYLFRNFSFCTCWWSVPIKSVHKLWQLNITVNFLHRVCLMSFDNFYYMSPCLGISYFPHVPSSWILRKASRGGLGILEVSHDVLLNLDWEPHRSWTNRCQPYQLSFLSDSYYNSSLWFVKVWIQKEKNNYCWNGYNL